MKLLLLMLSLAIGGPRAGAAIPVISSADHTFVVTFEATLRPSRRDQLAHQIAELSRDTGSDLSVQISPDAVVANLSARAADLLRTVGGVAEVTPVTKRVPTRGYVFQLRDASDAGEREDLVGRLRALQVLGRARKLDVHPFENLIMVELPAPEAEFLGRSAAVRTVRARVPLKPCDPALTQASDLRRG